MKLLIMTDIEGVAGVTSFGLHTEPQSPYYPMARRLLTGEVNAAIDGALAAGITDAVVGDGHGCGGIDHELIHEAASVRRGQPGTPVWQRKEFYEDFDCACMIGQHSMEGTADGNLNHTQDSRAVDHYRLNGKYIGEIAQWALCMGAYGLPMIFLSGDHAACREAEALIPGITTAAVKRGLARESAISLSPPRAQALIRQRMAAAIAKQEKDPLPPLVWPGPYRLEIRYKNTDSADGREQSGWERVDAKTVAIASHDILRIIYA